MSLSPRVLTVSPAAALVPRVACFQPDMPMLVMEFWVGWFDTWGSTHATRDANSKCGGAVVLAAMAVRVGALTGPDESLSSGHLNYSLSHVGLSGACGVSVNTNDPVLALPESRESGQRTTPAPWPLVHRCSEGG